MKKGTKILITTILIMVILVSGFFVARHLLQQKRTVTISGQQSNECLNSNQNSDVCQLPQQATESNQQETQKQDPQPDANAIVEQNGPVQSKEDARTQTVKTTNASLPKKVETQSTSTSSSNGIISRLISWGFKKSSDRKIDTIIVHTSYDAMGSDPYNVDGIIAEWKAAGVAPHYLISREGKIYQLVADQNIAWHAGVSKMPDGRQNVNDFSIGVEMVNTQDGEFTDDQYSALNQLIANLKKRYPIKYVLGHDDIAPGRKSDPWGMDWSRVNR